MRYKIRQIEVEARQLEKAERVETGMGVVLVPRGAWVLTDHRGRTGVVADEIFQECYVQVG